MIRESTQDKTVIFTFKLVILGAGGVGKTCLFNRFCFNSFKFDTSLTIGINFHSINIKLNHLDISNNLNEFYVANSIFDFGGQERFKSLIPKFLGGANGALFVFDLTNINSLEDLNFWHTLLVKYANGANIPKILVGSKNDLLDKDNSINRSLIEQFIQNKGIDSFVATSALKNYNVLEVFKKITNLMLQEQKVPYCVT